MANNFFKNSYDIENIAVPPHVILKLLLVEGHDGVITAIEDYYKQLSRSNVPGTEYIKSRLISYFFRAKASLTAEQSRKQKTFINKKSVAMEQKRKYSVEEIQQILFDTEEIQSLIEIFDYINNYLYNKGVLKFETGIKYDETDAEQSNQIRGFG